MVLGFRDAYSELFTGVTGQTELLSIFYIFRDNEWQKPIGQYNSRLSEANVVGVVTLCYQWREF